VAERVYLIFGGRQYYPEGGTGDLIADPFSSADAAAALRHGERVAEDHLNQQGPNAGDWWELAEIMPRRVRVIARGWRLTPDEFDREVFAADAD